MQSTAASLRARSREHGATAVEYALMVGLIAVVIVAAVTAFGISVSTSSSSPRGSSVARRERGAAAVEMAIVLPLLLLVVGGLVDFGRAYYLNSVITNAAREGARMVAMSYTTAQADAQGHPGCGRV